MKRIDALVVSVVLIAGCSSNESTNGNLRRIIFFGDSITELGVKPNGYVSIVRDSLRALGTEAEIIGEGISGNKVTDLQRRLTKDIIAKRPGIVFIYIGINDVWHYHFASRGLSGTPKDQYRTILTEIVREIQRTGAIVVLCTPSVIGEKRDGTNEWDGMLDEYASISRAVAEETSAMLLDLRKEFLDALQARNASNAEKNIFTYDGVHLNDAGNRLVADQVIKTLDGLGLFFPQK
jgi:lysophospholipase L1-like esterase